MRPGGRGRLSDSGQPLFSGATPAEPLSCPECCPHQSLDVNGRCRPFLEAKTEDKARSYAGFGMFLEMLG